MPRLFNINRDNVPDDAVRIGRGTPYGNPFIIGVDGNRMTCVLKFEMEVLPKLNVGELRGKDLACYCAPLPCHGESIMRKANA